MEREFEISQQMVVLAQKVGKFEAVSEVLILEPSWERKLKEEAVLRRLMVAPRGRVAREVVEKIVEYGPGRDESEGKVIREVNLKIDEQSVREIMNVLNVNRYVEQMVNLHGKGERLDLEKELLNIHSLVAERMIDSAALGVYRNAAVENELAPPPVELPYQMEDFFGSLQHKKEIYPLFRLGLMAYELVRLQPFGYGNRQTIYAFLRLNLLLGGYDKRRLLCLEEGWERDWREWEGLVEEENVGGFVEEFMGGMVEEMGKIGEKMARLAVGGERKGSGKQVALSNRQIGLIEEMEVKGELTMTAARKVLAEVSGDTILRDLKDLMAKGVVRKKGRTKGARYLLCK